MIFEIFEREILERESEVSDIGERERERERDMKEIRDIGEREK